MATKSITLDEITEGIYKEWRKNGDLFNFSEWIRSKMLEEYNRGQPKLATVGKIKRQGTPYRGYVCPNCKVDGHHWEERCPFPTKEEQKKKIINNLRNRAARGEEE